MGNRYLIVQWPDVQELMMKEGWEENSFLINDERGVQIYGSSAYFVEEDWYAKATGTVEE